MKKVFERLAIAGALIVATVIGAAADFYIIWSEEFTLQPAGGTEEAVGDMIGNGNDVVVGTINGNIQIRELATGAVLETFSIYDLQAESFTMIDVDGDGSMECLGAGPTTSGLIDWVIVAGSDPPEEGLQDRIDFGLHPNPSRSGATVSYALPASAAVELSVYSVSGRRVKTLINERQSEGAREITWDGRDDAGLRQAAGTYMIELRIDGRAASTRKSVLLR